METTVAGRKVEYGVDENGVFTASYNGEEYQHVTLAGLKGALERQMKKAPLKIPCVMVESFHADNPEITKGVIVGVHSGNGNLLIKWEGQSTAEQCGRYHGDKLLSGSVDLKKLKALHQAKCKAEKVLDDFLEKNQIDRHAIKMDAKAE